jgi:uncharacterized protein (DUF1501 family)
MQRRTFLRRTASALALGTAAQTLGGMPLYADSPVKNLGGNIANTDNILVIIQLFGGNDGLNTVIPADNPDYYRLRPTLGIPKATATRLFGSNVYLHPALSRNVPFGGMQQLYQDGRLAIIQGVGYENPNLSHFRSTDIWLSGFNNSSPNARLTDGWIGRHLASRYATGAAGQASLPDYPLCIQVGGTLSTMLKSDTRGDMGIALADPEEFFRLGRGLTPDDEEMVETSTVDTSTFAAEYNYIRTIAQKSDRYSHVVKQAFDRGRNTVDYASGFSQQLRMVSRLISGGLQSKVYLVYLGGFDTHVLQQQPDGSGIHPRLLRDLSTGIAQFMRDALQQGFADRVVGMTISEFGRRPHENGSAGTDHGAAGVQFVFGNNVNGNVFGTLPDLQNLNNNGDLQYQYDYRRVYANVLQAWLGASEQDTTSILGERIAPLPVVNRRATTSVSEAAQMVSGGTVAVYPNPSQGLSTVAFELRSAAHVNLALFTIEGRLVQTVFDGTLSTGLHNLPCAVASGLAGGAYICMLRVGGTAVSTTLTLIR